VRSPAPPGRNDLGRPPVTLTWQAASDEITPPSLIVHDLYMATRQGGEDFSAPTWTTPPGATALKTPGLPSHGTFFFVVRASDPV